MSAEEACAHAEQLAQTGKVKDAVDYLLQFREQHFSSLSNSDKLDVVLALVNMLVYLGRLDETLKVLQDSISGKCNVQVLGTELVQGKAEDQQEDFNVYLQLGRIHFQYGQYRSSLLKCLRDLYSAEMALLW